MAEAYQPGSIVQCTGCGRELSKELSKCPFCGQDLLLSAEGQGESVADDSTAAEVPALPQPSLPIDWTRFALAGTIGLLAALILGYAWYLIALQAEREFSLVALIIGLIVGVVVALVSGGNLAIPYRLLGALLALGSLAFGEYLIYARPQSSFYFEFNTVLLLIYGIAFLEGWQAPRFVARRGLSLGLINKDNQGLLLAASAVLVLVLLAAGLFTGVLVGPAAVQAKIHATRAVTHLEAGESDQAAAELQLALEDYEEFADAHFFLGLVQANQFALADAGDSLSRALEIGLEGFRYAEAHYQLGFINWIMDDGQTALDHMTQAIDAGVEYGDAYLVRAEILLQQGQDAAAEADINQALMMGLSDSDQDWAQSLLEDATGEA